MLQITCQKPRRVYTDRLSEQLVMRCSALLFTLVLAALAPATVLGLEPEAQRDGAPRVELDLTRALAIGRERGRDARAAQEDLAAAFQRMNFVRASYHPTGALTADTTDTESLTLDQKLSESTHATVTLNHVPNHEITRAYSIDHALFVNNAYDVRLANLNYAIARETFRVTIEDYKLEAVRRFFELLRAQLRLRTLIEAVGRAGDLVASAKARFDLGTTSKLDVLNTEVELANARNAVIAQRQAVDKARDDLLDQIGLPLDTAVDAADPLKLERPEEPAPGWYRSELAIDRGHLEVARTQMNEARYLAHPDMHVNATVNLDPQGVGTDLIGTVRYNFPIGTAPSDHTYRQLKHAYETAALAYQTRQVLVAKDQRDIRRTLSTKEESVKIAELALANATEAYEASQISFSRGLISNIDLRTAQANLTNARDAYLSLLIDYRFAVFQYRRLFGGEL